MTEVIRISESIFQRLQVLATPLVDTPASVVEKLLDFYEAHNLSLRPQGINPRTSSPPQPGPNSNLSAVLDVDNPPDLSHTKILKAEFAGITASSWNDLVRVAHRYALGHFRSFEALRSCTQSNIDKGRRTDKGFHYVPDLDISIQNVKAGDCWANALHLARKLGVSVSADFEWLHNAKAAPPGSKGVLQLEIP